ncbi:DMT family transporter [Marinilabiliaceae bacterium JC017]|nr:DMT family transporter [Marinilabiliaceae bacterium JC017]
MYSKYVFTFIALLIGGLIAVQGSINTQLSSYLRHPLQASFTNFLVGTICLLFINVLLRTGMPKGQELTGIPVYLFFGGILGAIFVSSVVILIPKIGVTTMLGATIAGQMVIATFIDHHGYFNVPVHAASPGRVMGIVLLLAGIFLIQRF